MTALLIILLSVIYYFGSRIVGNFVINLVDPIERQKDSAIVLFVLWAPFIGELYALIYMFIFFASTGVYWINEKTDKMASAIKSRIK